MDLDGEIRAFCAGLASIELGHGELLQIGPPLIHIPGGPIGQKPRRVDLQSHLCDHFLHELEAADRAAESLALLGEGERVIETGLRQAERTGGEENARLPIAAVQHDPSAARVR